MPWKTMTASLAVALLAASSVHAGECPLAEDATAGRNAANQCRSCHVFDADLPSRASGPNLHDVFGRRAGSLTDFSRYSDGMKGAGAKGMIWTEDNIVAYIADPRAFLIAVNGAPVHNAMFYYLKDEQKRKDIAAYLKAIKGKPDCH